MQITKANLISRVVRASIGERKLDLSMKFTQQENSEGNVITRFFAGTWNALSGFLSAAANLLRHINFSSIFGMLQSEWTKFYNFNWNSTDAQLRQQLEGQRVGLYGIWGGAFGSAFGWLSAIVVGTGIAYFCPVIGGATLAKAIAGETLPEAVQEVAPSFTAAMGATYSYFVDVGKTNAYINIRKMIKAAPPTLLNSVFGEERAKWMRNQWGNEGQPVISFAQAQEDYIESLPPEWQAFAEEFSEEAWESFCEAGYLIAGELDAAWQQAKAGQSLHQGKERAIEIIPDKRNENEKIILKGSEEEIKQQTIDYLTKYRQIGARDVGAIVGMPADDYYRARPQRRKLTLVFKSLPSPPYYSPGSVVKSATYTIPDPKPNLTWEKIKRAARQYNWGKFRATASLNNGRQMAVYGASASIAEEKLRDLLDLTIAEVETMSVTEEKERNPRLRKDATLLYPAYGSFLIRIPTTDPSEGRHFTNGDNVNETTIRFDLWCDDEPQEFGTIRQLATASTTNEASS